MVTHCLFTALESSCPAYLADHKALAIQYGIEITENSLADCFENHGAFDIAVFFVNSEQVEDSLKLFSKLCGIIGFPPVLLVGDGLDPSQLTQFIRLGASDFALAPLLPEELVVRIQCILGKIPRLAKTKVRDMLDPRSDNLIGSSPEFLSRLAKLPVLAGCDATVLILGETGTGKEEFARAIHYLSARSGKPLITVNSAAIPSDLFENELFGHSKGAYTTALTCYDGLIRQADGGTLFLDEIDALPYAVQAKLLRFLQNREFRPLGANNIQYADVRIIAASNRRLTELVQLKTFREDLYFRLNVLQLDLPCLSERREDIPLLAQHFLQEFTRQYKRPAAAFSPEALRKLLLYGWPGNIRELRNIIERAVLISDGGTLRDEHIELGEKQTPMPDDQSFKASKARIVSSFEKTYVEGLLAASKGNVSHAAKAAQKNRRAFFELMRKHCVDPSVFRP